MAGINRLGKGPAKPGTMRPADPNKYKTMDIFSEGTEGDKDYARMVQDIEDTQQNHTGWLFGRGAFDKGDLLYLRDEEEKRRFQEQELRESELRSFARMRQRTQLPEENEHDPGPDAKTDSGRGKIAKHIIVKKPGSKVRPKREDTVPLPDPKRSRTAPASAVKQEVKQEESRPEGDGGGLAGLLGDYGSDCEEEEAPPPKVKQEPLPLPDMFLNQEVKAETVRQPAATAAHSSAEVAEELDYGSDSEED